MPIGRMQEELLSLSKLVLMKRERSEAVKAGTVKLVGTDAEAIVENVNLLLRDSEIYEKISQAHNPYGDRKECERIVNCIK